MINGRTVPESNSNKRVRLRSIIIAAVLAGAIVLTIIVSFVYQALNSGFCTNSGNGHPSVVNIHCYYSKPPVPTGISDYGVINRSGNWSGYIVEARQVVGETTIYAISADNPDQGDSRHIVGLQLNTVLVVSTTQGNQSYWVQNIAFFGTNGSYIYFSNQIWNFTTPNAVIESSHISGNGNVTKGAYSILSNLPVAPYTLPIKFDIITNETQTPHGVVINEAFRTISGSSLGSSVYDRIMIITPGIRTATLEINGFKRPGTGYYYAELVFTGPPGSSVVAFSSLNATIGLEYTLIDGTITQPRSLWEFGFTGEAVTNLQTNLVGGRFVVAIGKADLNQDYLTG